MAARAPVLLRVAAVALVAAAAAAARVATAAAPPALTAVVATVDMPSHVISGTKWSLHLAAAGHDVTLAVPQGASAALAQRELDADPAGAAVTVAGTGSLQAWPPKELIAALRFLPKPQSWASVRAALSQESFLTSVFKMANDAHEPMFEPLADLLRSVRPDVIVADMPLATLAADAAELAGCDAPVVMGVPWPYDTRIAYESAFDVPGGLVPRQRGFFPHTALYPAQPPPGPAGWAQRAWLWLEALVEQRHIDKYNSEYLPMARERHGLPALPDGAPVRTQVPWRGPIVSVGGAPLTLPHPAPPRVAVVGAMERPPPPMAAGSEELASWLADPATLDAGVVYVAMGTGMTLHAEEARAIAAELGADLAGARGGPRLLWSLRQSEQEILWPELEAAMGPAELTPSGAKTFLNGTVRVEAFVPQRSVLAAGAVRLFLSHMGMGSFCEGTVAGVPFLAYPGFSDQFANAQRAVDAGTARVVPPGMSGLGAAAREALAPGSPMAVAAVAARDQLEAAGGGAAAVAHIEAAARGTLGYP